MLGVVFLTAGLLAGCGSSSSATGSSSSAKTLLTETFTGRHNLNSGVLRASLTLTPTGSSVLTKPIVLAFGGPFQSRGSGKLPASHFNVSISLENHTGSLGFVSTGTAGYVELSGAAYALPAAEFKKLESGFSSVGGSSSGASSSTSSVFAKFGIDPQRWLSHPVVVGTASVGGAQTEHIHGSIALAPLLSDLSTLLAKAPSVSSTGASLPKALSPATQAKITSAVKGATFDLWTGSSDHTIRRLTVSARVPITSTSGVLSELGGLSSLDISFTLSYSDIGQHQTVTAPTSARPYSQFQTELSETIQEIEAAILGAEGTTGSSTTGASADSAYSQCVSAAGTNTADLEKCAALLGSG